VTGEWAEGIDYKRWGLDKGENPPFVTRFQKWLWQPQSADNLIQECVRLDQEIGPDGANSAAAEKRLDSPITPAMVRARNYECSWLTLHPRPEDIAFLTESYHLIDAADRSDPLLRLKWAALCFYFGDVVEAVTHILGVMKETGEAGFLNLDMTEEMFYPVGMAFEHLSNYGLAAEFYERANGNEKTDLSLLDRLAGVHKQLENYDRAAAIFEFLEKNDVDHPRVSSELADIRKRMGSG
jgi:tetratricopeptide (TPR) repeat protein